MNFVRPHYSLNNFQRHGIWVERNSIAIVHHVMCPIHYITNKVFSYNLSWSVGHLIKWRVFLDFLEHLNCQNTAKQVYIATATVCNMQHNSKNSLIIWKCNNIPLWNHKKELSLTLLVNIWKFIPYTIFVCNCFRVEPWVGCKPVIRSI